jgi:hypothetical protein
MLKNGCKVISVSWVSLVLQIQIVANKNQKGYNDSREDKTEEEGDGNEHISVLTLA